MDNQPNLPTPEQWEPVQDALECAARAYWEQQFDEAWDYMLDDTELELAKIVRDYFPEMDAKCKQQAKERVEEMEDACRPLEEKTMSAKTIDDLHKIFDDYDVISVKIEKILQDEDMDNLDKQGYVMSWGFWTEKGNRCRIHRRQVSGLLHAG